MVNRHQNTLQTSVSFTGIGAHCGEVIKLTLEPAPENAGRILIRDDLSDNNRIPVSHKNVITSPLCTTLINDDSVSVSTVEHLLATLYSLQVDNVYIHVKGVEVPIFDGSALEIIKLVRSAGICEQKAPKKMLVILKEVAYTDSDKSVKILPNDSLAINITCDFSQKGLGVSHYSYEHSPEKFEKEIAFSRTFGFWEDAEVIRKAGLAKGSSLDNTVIFKDGKCMNQSGLRSPTEYITHKILDIIGDLSVAGYDICGHFYGNKPGHAINGLLVKKVLSDPSCFKIV